MSLLCIGPCTSMVLYVYDSTIFRRRRTKENGWKSNEKNRSMCLCVKVSHSEGGRKMIELVIKARCNIAIERLVEEIYINRDNCFGCGIVVDTH